MVAAFTRFRRLLRAVFLFTGRAALWSSVHVYRTPTEIETRARMGREAQWYKDRGDQTLRLQYDLTPGSLVYDVGGFEGNFAADLSCRFGCRIKVFEPIVDFAETIEERFRHNPNVEVHRYGLSGADGELLMTREQGGSSAVIVGEVPPTERVILRDIAGVLEEFSDDNVDLIKINIEGGEYDLLDRLIERDLLGRFRHIQVQFHLHAPEANVRMERIVKALESTHELSWRYPWVWESWTLRDASSGQIAS
jgi:FkbM family methyltransferase